MSHAVLTLCTGFSLCSSRCRSTNRWVCVAHCLDVLRNPTSPPSGSSSICPCLCPLTWIVYFNPRTLITIQPPTHWDSNPGCVAKSATRNLSERCTAGNGVECGRANRPPRAAPTEDRRGPSEEVRVEERDCGWPGRYSSPAPQAQCENGFKYW